MGPLAVAGATNGCLGRITGGPGSATPTPVDLSGGKADDQGGMVIGRHGGPNGQIFYADHRPAGHDNPAWFHTLSFGLFPYYFEHRELGWRATAIYVTDYSTVEYTVTGGDRKVITSPTAADTFGNAKAMTYVVGSDVYGGMGPELIPFGTDDDARAFVDRYGGRTVTFEDVTPVFLSRYTG